MYLFQRYSIFPLSIILILSLMASGCTLSRLNKLSEQHEIKIQPSPLQADFRQVDFEIKASVPAKLIRKGYSYELEVYYMYGEQERDLIGTLPFEPDNFTLENGKPTIISKLTFPYAQRKNRGNLYVQGKVSHKKKGFFLYNTPKQVAQGLFTTPQLLVSSHETTFLPTSAQEKNRQTELTFYFDSGEKILKKQDPFHLYALNRLQAQSGTQKAFQLIARESPEEFGSALSAERAKALENYLSEQLEEVSNTKTKKPVFHLHPSEHILNLLIIKIQLSALPGHQVNEVIEILNGDINLHEKMNVLMGTEAYPYLQKYIYPSMRSVTVRFEENLNRAKQGDRQPLAKKISNEMLDATVLREEKIPYLTQFTPLQEQELRYKEQIKRQDSWADYENLGKVYMLQSLQEVVPSLKQALAAKAIHYLNYAGLMHPSTEVFLHLAAAYNLHGDVLEALHYYNYAILLGKDQKLLHQAFTHKGTLEAATGQYEDAIESLSYGGNNYQKNMNMGLCLLLMEKYEDALLYYNRALENKPHDAQANYCIAVIGARTKNEKLLTDHLKRAVYKDNYFASRAMDDLEFSSYREKPLFRTALIRLLPQKPGKNIVF